MTVSIKDIARVAGVSHSTVSRALSGSTLVNADTAERIRQLADEMGYTPSAIGRSLVTRRTQTLGLVVTRIADPFIAEVAQAVELTIMDHGYSLLIASAGDPKRELAAVRMLRERRVDGIVVQSSVVGTRYMGLLSDLQVPIVLINNQADGQYIYSVGINNVASARLAVDHLIQHGHTRIGYISGPVDAVARGQRRQGWSEALTAAGLPVDEKLVVEPSAGGGLPTGGEAGTRALLALPDPPTAIFCYNDMTALGALRAAREAGRHIPTDLSIVGFDDIALAAYTDPPLTTIAQPKAEMGRRAVEMLLALLGKANGADVARAVLLAGRLVDRGSVGGEISSSIERM